MISPFLGEFCGTTTLILLGDGVVAGVLLAKSKAHNAGWIVISAGWAFAVVCGIFVSQALGGQGYLNPVSPLVDLLVEHRNPLWDNLQMIAGEFSGAFVGAILVWLHYLPHWAETKDPAAKLGVFCTAPAIRNYPANFVSEFIGTFALVFIASSVGKKTIGDLEPAVIGIVIWAIGLSLGGTTGYAINPARDLGPRLAHAILPIAGKGGSDWAYAWVPVCGPIAGGLTAAGLFKWLFVW